MREIAIAEQLGLFMAQGHDLFHQGAVVILAVMGPLVGGPGHVGSVELLAQRTVLGMGHHRVVGGEVQGDQPAFFLFGVPGGLGQHVQCGIGQSGQGRAVQNRFLPGVGAVQDVLLETGLEIGQFLGNGLVAGLLVFRQIHAAQMEVTQGIAHHLALGLVQIPGSGTLAQGLVGRVERRVLADLGAVIGELGQAGVVGGAQLLAVDHRVHVPNRRPGPVEPVLQQGQGMHQVLPGKATVPIQQFRDGGAVLGQQAIDGRLHVFGSDLAEGRQAFLLEQGVFHGGSWGLDQSDVCDPHFITRLFTAVMSLLPGLVCAQRWNKARFGCILCFVHQNQDRDFPHIFSRNVTISGCLLPSGQGHIVNSQDKYFK